MPYAVTEIKGMVREPKVIVGTTTHGNGERMRVLKRNLVNLSLQDFHDWGQIIMVDHSPKVVARQIAMMVSELPDADRRAVYWMNGDKPTKRWGKTSHNEILKLAKGKASYYSFHSDDNFMAKNHLSSLLAFLEPQSELDFAYALCARLHSKGIFPLKDFVLGHVDLGSPLFRINPCFTRYVPDLNEVADKYEWDWLMLARMVNKGAKFTCSGRLTYIWAQFRNCDQKKLEQTCTVVDRSTFESLSKRYAGFRSWA